MCYVYTIKVHNFDFRSVTPKPELIPPPHHQQQEEAINLSVKKPFIKEDREDEETPPPSCDSSPSQIHPAFETVKNWARGYNSGEKTSTVEPTSM